MSTLPKISVVTISFNQQEYLERAIRSVLDQDYKNLEYIIVDPGSSDGSREIIERYRPAMAKVIFEPDKGPADGLNEGFSVATGEIFGFLNADDVLYPGALEAAAIFLQQRPEVDVVSGHARIIGPDDAILRSAYSDRFLLPMAAYGHSILMQPSTFFRRQIYTRVGGFNIENRSNWDGELFVDFAIAKAKFAVCGKIWSGYRLHGTSITLTGKMHAAYQLHAQRMFAKIKKRDPSPIDSIAGQSARLLRKLLNPRDTWERIRKGPIYLRSA